MIDLFSPSARPENLLDAAWQNTNSKVRLVGDGTGGSFVEADFDHAPITLRELLSLLDDIGWAPVPEEVEDCALTADGNGCRIRVRFEGEMIAGDY
jgi:hypothetical protein